VNREERHHGRWVTHYLGGWDELLAREHLELPLGRDDVHDAPTGVRRAGEVHHPSVGELAAR
jgi:hypothetical protein